MGKSAGSPPPAPDYIGAAEAQAQSQRINQYTPYGNLVYSPVGAQPGAQGAPTAPSAPVAPVTPTASQGSGDPFFDAVSAFHGGGGGGTGSPIQNLAQQRTQPTAGGQQWQSQIQLDPNIQGARESQLGFLKDKYSQPFDMQSVQDISDKAYGSMTARLDPEWQQREQMERTRLANQGLTSGGEAYGNAMREFGQARNDAYQQANIGSIGLMPQTYELASAAYNQPLSALNALRGQDPQFGGAGQPTNYMSAAEAASNYAGDIYNTKQSAANANRQAAAQAITMAAILASDRRLKDNIERIGTHPLGIGVYEYDIDGRHEVGVMADEVETVMPDAVVTRPDGYKMVNYAMLNGLV